MFNWHRNHRRGPRTHVAVPTRLSLPGHVIVLGDALQGVA
jgi:hypothetical protein